MDGVSLGDSFGQTFFDAEDAAKERIGNRSIPDGTWWLTDDSIMAAAVYSNVTEAGRIDQDRLVNRFVERFNRDRTRGYGATMARMLRQVSEGLDWKNVAQDAFAGMGSFGNGAAMRVAPIGAYLAGDEKAISLNARLSAETTHTHIDGIAGAMAVAHACGWVVAHKPQQPTADMLGYVARFIPRSETRDRIGAAAGLSLASDVRTAAAVLGNGLNLSAQDTVPFALWCAARHLDHFEDAIWTTVAGLGDRDTTCAIAGGIVALAVGSAGLPKAWLKRREPIKPWLSQLQP